MRIEWARQADEMLDEALDRIGEERPLVALRWLDALMNQVRTLEQFPDSGRMVPEYQRPEIREILADPYRVPYHRGEDAVTILAVTHSRRAFDLGAQLD